MPFCRVLVGSAASGARTQKMFCVRPIVFSDIDGVQLFAAPLARALAPGLPQHVHVWASSARMGPGRKPRSATASKPVQASWQLTVEGGLLKVPTVVGSVKEHYKGRDIAFVPVAATTPWLCEMVAGQCASKRPLGRCSIIATLRKLLIQDDASIVLPAGDDKMNQLFDQDDEPEKVATPKIKRPRGRAAEAFVKAVVEVRVPVPSVMLDAPEESGKAAPVEATGATPAEAGERSLLMLRCSDLAPRIEIDALPWLVAVLQTEREARGVPLIKKRADSRKGDIWWDFTNSLWRGRFYDAEGKEHSRSQCVLRRLRGDLTHLDFQDAKARVFEEMVHWRDELLGRASAS